MLKGTAASAGIGIGKAVLIREDSLDVRKTTVRFVEEEKQRFLDAVERFVEELEIAKSIVEKNIGPDEAMILGAHIAIVRDPELLKEVLRTIERQQVNAEYAFHMICNGYIALFSNLEDERMAARSVDFEDIRRRMLHILMGSHSVDLSGVPAGSVLVAHDIPPSQAAEIDTSRITGIVTRRGARFSHIAIIARALRLPAIVAVDNLFEQIAEGSSLIVDGHRGVIYTSPTDQELLEYAEMARAEQRRHIEIQRFQKMPTQTADGRSIRLEANYAMDQELAIIEAYSADGIGLLRTEFLYMNRRRPPSEEDQLAVYNQVTAAMHGKPVVIRTLDIGGDKEIPCLSIAKEENPFLGLRGIRYCLSHPELFKVQLAALMRAAAFGNVQIMCPMISCLSELRAVKALMAEVAEDLTLRGLPFRADVPVGIMLETPAAVLCADQLAKESAFFSIGTNDLTQYVLAADRANPRIARLYDTMHPAVLRMIDLAVQAADHAGIPVSVCGEAASDPLLLLFLLGAGVQTLSVNPAMLLEVRCQLHSLSYQDCRALVPELLAMSTAEEVRHRLSQFSAQTAQ